MWIAQAGGTDWGPIVASAIVAVAAVIVGQAITYWATVRHWDRQQATEREHWAEQRAHDRYLWDLQQRRDLYARAVAATQAAHAAVSSMAHAMLFGLDAAGEETERAKDALDDLAEATAEVYVVAPGPFSDKLSQLNISLAHLLVRTWMSGRDIVVGDESVDYSAQGVWDDSQMFQPHVAELGSLAREELSRPPVTT